MGVESQHDAGAGDATNPLTAFSTAAALATASCLPLARNRTTPLEAAERTQPTSRAVITSSGEATHA